MVPGSRVWDVDGHAWCRVVGPAGVYWWRIGTGGIEILAGAPVGDVPAIMQLMFQQSKI